MVHKRNHKEFGGLNRKRNVINPAGGKPVQTETFLKVLLATILYLKENSSPASKTGFCAEC